MTCTSLPVGVAFLIAFALILAWDALRRFAERNDEFDPEDYEHMHDQLKATEALAAELGRAVATLKAAREAQSEHISKLLAQVELMESTLITDVSAMRDLRDTVANHAAALERHNTQIAGIALRAGRKS